jgi:hypothetical protein
MTASDHSDVIINNAWALPIYFLVLAFIVYVVVGLVRNGWHRIKSDTTGRMRQLTALNDAGLITDEEFATPRAKLLEEL